MMIDKCAGSVSPHAHHFTETETMLDSQGNIKTLQSNHHYLLYNVRMLIAEEEQPAFVSAMRGFLVVLALSLHEMFEGIALGLATTER